MKIDLSLLELNHLWKTLEHYSGFHGELMQSIKSQVEAATAVPTAPTEADPASND
jgi:hypothetical protein